VRAVEGKVKDESRAGAVLYAKDVDRLASFYSTVLGLSEANRDHDHVVLESPGFQLVVLQIPHEIAKAIEITVPPARRATAAVKLVFFIPSLDDVRASVEACGGVMNPVDTEWSFQGFTVCDGLDPEGNVIQFRSLTRA
jgi:catechol 2,3-dioxygenase-like lactoylglutathione lyase family enzyme